jgi:hypothetical protein
MMKQVLKNQNKYLLITQYVLKWGGTSSSYNVKTSP